MATYECMILVEPSAAAKDWQKVVQEVEKLLQKHGAKVCSLASWGDRKLAYPIRRLQRATYLLLYFEGPTESPRGIRADLILSDTFLRSMIVRHEGPIPEPAALAAPAPVVATTGTTR